MAPYDDDEEDDYLNMTFDEPPPKTETSLQRTARLKKAAAQRSRPISQAERSALAQERLETALVTELDPTCNRGAHIMAKMGFRPGDALGNTEGARTRPLEVAIKDDRAGIGLESERKRRLREAAETCAGREKRIKVDEDEYRYRTRALQELRRREGQMWAAMRVLEGLEMDSLGQGGEDGEGPSPSLLQRSRGKKLRCVENVLWRPLVKQRLEEERERRRRCDWTQSLSRRNECTEDDRDESLAYSEEIEEDVEEEDAELEAFEALPVGERLGKVVGYLREKYHYCFWCKFRYPDEEMEDCPGFTEEEHE